MLGFGVVSSMSAVTSKTARSLSYAGLDVSGKMRQQFSGCQMPTRYREISFALYVFYVLDYQFDVFMAEHMHVVDGL